MKSEFSRILGFVIVATMIYPCLIHSKENSKITINSAKKIAILPLWCHDIKAAKAIHETLITAMAKKSSIPLSTKENIIETCKSINVKKGPLTPQDAKQCGEALGVDVVIFGSIDDFILRETESELMGDDSKKKELTATVKYVLEWQIMTVADSQIHGNGSDSISTQDTRTNIYKTALTDAQKDEFPAATLLLIERSTRDAAKKILSRVKFVP